MTRKYRSRRREESAERTRQAIVEAAVKMHHQGITTMSAVAEEAGVSLPTVNKYFPTREDLFAACTGHVAATLDYPSLEALSAIEDRAQRIREVVREAYRLHETTLGTTWTGYRLEDESPMLARALAEYEDFVGVLAAILLDDWSGANRETTDGFVRAMLSPLMYRVLRLKSGLDIEEAIQQTAQALIYTLDA